MNGEFFLLCRSFFFFFAFVSFFEILFRVFYPYKDYNYDYEINNNIMVIWRCNFVTNYIIMTLSALKKRPLFSFVH